jgi:hypothetical protein
MALHATYLALHTLAVRRFYDVLVATHAILLRMHAAVKFRGCYIKVAFLTVSRLPGKAFLSMTTKTAIVTELGIRRLGTQGLADRKRYSNSQNEQQVKDADFGVLHRGVILVFNYGPCPNIVLLNNSDYDVGQN